MVRDALRMIRAAAIGALALIAMGAVQAAPASFSLALDTDDDSRTGCAVAAPDGALDGIEAIFTAVVETSTIDARVIRLERQVCDGGVLGPPVTYDVGGWSVGLGNGIGGTAVIEASIPLTLLPRGAVMRAYGLSTGGGGADVTAGFRIALSGGPESPVTPIAPVPLSPWLVLPLALGMLLVAGWVRRRYPRETGLFVLVLVFAVSGLVWAASVVRDGLVADWVGIAPAATDARGDAPPDADIVAVFQHQDAEQLYFRIDADVRLETAAPPPPPANLPPTVNAGPAQTITLPASANLAGTASDDGLPNPPGALTTTWSKVSGPGTVSFGNANALATTAAFDTAGVYVLRLTASDGALTAASDVTITVNAVVVPPPVNGPPTVSAGPAQTITLPAAANLAGTASDDGLPNPPGALTTTWSKVSGPGTVTFGNASALATTAAFSVAGVYVLRLTASDGALSAFADVTITVNAVVVPPPVNGPPTVNAGPAQTITLPAAANLAGTASDDGLPNPPGALTTTWSKVSGPGTVSFGNASALATTAAFDTAGVYVLRLTASDGALSAASDVTITVNAVVVPPPVNGPPTVNAGPAQTITLPAAANLAGTASDDGLPNPPGALTTTWSKVSGPGTVNFGNANALATTAAFSVAGTYVLRLTASDSALSSTSDVTITVNAVVTPPPTNRPPTVNAGPAQTITLPAPANLAGTASDDGLPNPPGALTTTWSKVSGPGTLTFGNASALATTAAFSVAGVYVLRLTASDSALTAASDVTITVNAPVGSANRPPVLAAQPNQTVALGATFSRTLTATDPDLGDVLTFSLVVGPSGMTLSGGQLAWSTSGQPMGDHPVVVRVSDAAGAFDQKGFVITLGATVAPIARDDEYRVRPAATLSVAAPGVLANDTSASGGSLAATKLTDPDQGTLPAFSADGSFTYVAPNTSPPEPSLDPRLLWRGYVGYAGNSYNFAADVDHDGAADLVHTGFGIPVAWNGRTGALLWRDIDTSPSSPARNCGMYGFGTEAALGDVDGSGDITLITATNCDNRYTSGKSTRLIAIDTNPAHAVGGAPRVKWVSERFDQGIPRADGSVAQLDLGLTAFATPTLARLTPGGGVKVLTRILIHSSLGRYDHAGDGSDYRYAGCRAATGNPADEGKGCKVTFITDAGTGVIEAVLTAPNPLNETESAFRGIMRQTAPVVADFDGDGQVEIISGGDVFKYASGQWTLAWQASYTAPGLQKFYEPVAVAVADLDGDGKAEVVVQARWDMDYWLHRGILVYRHDGVLQRVFTTHTNNEEGMLGIADVDGDGAPEIVLQGAGLVLAYRPDGRLLWAHALPDSVEPLPNGGPTPPLEPQPYRHSAMGPVQVYDLDLDGTPEVIVPGARRLFILDGRTGLERWSIDTEGYHLYDRAIPLIVDADGDGHADILFAAGERWNCDVAACRGNGMAVSGPGHWAPAGLVFNQVNYNPWAIDDVGRIAYDGGVHRSFRQPRQRGTPVDPRITRTATFTYQVTDAGGTSAPATVRVRVEPENSPPVITSTPPSAVRSAAPYPPYTYAVTAYDPDPGDSVRYELVYTSSTQFSSTIDPVTGVLTGPTGPCGSYYGPCNYSVFLIIAAVDNHGARTEQSFELVVTPDIRAVPNVVGQMLPPAQTTLEAAELKWQVASEVFAAEPVGTVIGQDPAAGAPNVPRNATVNLTVSKGPAPVLMPYLVGKPATEAAQILDAAGLAYSIDAVASPSTPVGIVLAQDPAFGALVMPGATSVTLGVSAGPPLAKPVAAIVVEPGETTRLVAETLAYKATAVFTDGTSADVTLRATWSSSAPAVASVSVSGLAKGVAAGDATVTASLSGKTGSAVLHIRTRVADPTPPTAVIATPSDGATITGPVDVTGTASDANFLRYVLAYAADGDDAFTTITEGASPITGGTLGRFDPTVLLNGAYTLELRVFDRAGSVSVARTSVTVDGNRKIGAFTLSYTDLTVPLSGIPIQIVRTYDSRNKARGDFGIGWTLGLKALRVAMTRAPGEGWQVRMNGPNYELDPGARRYITVALPNGRTETFDLEISPASSPLVPFQTVRARVVSRPGNLGTLEILSNTDLLVVDPQPGPVTLVDDATLRPFEPDRFRYRQRDGTEFVVTRSRGVESVTDASGNSITVTRDGISHSTGVAIHFTRDVQGRITMITDPAGNVRTYAYSSEGDLASATDRTGATTRYFYDRLHGIVRIEDPLGRTGTRTDYDDAGRVISITDANGNTTQYRHDLDGRQEQVEDALGRVTIYTYDDRGNVTAKTDPLGHTVTATFDARDRMTSSTDALGATTLYEYDGQDQLTRVVDPLGNARTMSYDVDGNLTLVADSRGKATTLRYDASHNLVGSVDPLGHATNYTVDSAGNVTSIEQPGGSVTSIAYDPLGRRSATIGPGGTVTTYAYDGVGNAVGQASHDGGMTSVAFDREGRIVGKSVGGRSTSLTYDGAGVVSSLTLPTGNRVGLTSDAAGRLTGFTGAGNQSLLGHSYDAVGNLVSASLGDGVRSDYQYDAANRLVAITNASGATERRIYDAAGRVVQLTDGRGFSRYFEWDAAGRLTASTDALGGVTRHAYDAVGNEVTTTDPLGRVTRYDYDDLDRVTQVTYPDGSTERQTFDDAGNVATHVDASGATTRFSYDAMGRLTQVTDALGNTLVHTYTGASGLPTRSVDARGAITQYRYDPEGRLLETTYPDGQVESNTYDGLGLRVRRQNAAGEVTTWHHDASGRVDLMTLSDGSTVAFTYANDGKRTSMTDARGTTTYQYDAAGRLARVTEPDGTYVRYEYDNVGLRTRIAHRGASGAERVLDYAYDALGRVATLSDSTGGVSHRTYDLAGNVTTITHPNGVTTTLDYDVRNRVQAITHRGSGGVLLAGETYTRDGRGDVTRIARSDGTAVEYAYDALRQVIGETRYGSGGGIEAQNTYGYDAAGNRVLAGGVGSPVTFAYDATGRLIAGDGIDYGYDAAGRRISARWIDGATPRTARYLWDSLDRLVGFEDGRGATWSYGYDADGLRVHKAGASGTTRFILDREHPTGFAQLLRAEGGGPTQTYDWLEGLATVVEGSTTMAPLTDALGSVRALTGPGGAVSDTFAYDAYGRLVARTGSAAALHRFAGEAFDPESQLAYLRARYYDPRTGAFLSRDPLRPPLDSTQAANPYLYALANPVNRRDPSGQATIIDLNVSQAISNTLKKGDTVLKQRKALARTWDTAIDAERIYGGVMALETVVFAFSGAEGRASVKRWFDIGIITREALDGLAADLGEFAGSSIGLLATAGMGKIGFDMLGGKQVEIHVDGFGVLFASSLDEARTQAKTGATKAARVCSEEPDGIAYASRTEASIALCRRALAMPLRPDVSTMTIPGRASLPGILLHEYAHLSLGIRDTRYGCGKDGVREIFRALGSNLLALGNADSYRCWAEDVQLTGQFMGTFNGGAH